MKKIHVSNGSVDGISYVSEDVTVSHGANGQTYQLADGVEIALGWVCALDEAGIPSFSPPPSVS